MGIYQAPTKEQVREYLQRRFESNGPLPSISEIRHELGWSEQHAKDGKPAGSSCGAPEREDSTA